MKLRLLLDIHQTRSSWYYFNLSSASSKLRRAITSLLTHYIGKHGLAKHSTRSLGAQLLYLLMHTFLQIFQLQKLGNVLMHQSKLKG